MLLLIYFMLYYVFEENYNILRILTYTHTHTHPQTYMTNSSNRMDGTSLVFFICQLLTWTLDEEGKQTEMSWREFNLARLV